MKTIGLLGGMSWESTLTYYKVINEIVKEQLGGLHSAKILLYSVDFDEIETCQAAGNWQKSAELLGTAAKALETAGADFIVICTNTMHKIVPEICERITIPLLHIAEAAAQKLHQHKIQKVALLGTRYTMTENFYKDILIREGIEVVIPEEAEMDMIHHVIYEELCKGILLASSKEKYLEVIDHLYQKGAQGVLLGCTEIGLLIQQEDCMLPLFDTALLHAEAAASLALEHEL